MPDEPMPDSVPIIFPDDLETLEFTGYRNENGSLDAFGSVWQDWPNAIMIPKGDGTQHRFRCLDSDSKANIEAHEDGRPGELAWYVNE